jgi:hypothetical protein
MDSNQLASLEATALERLQKRHKAKNLQLARVLVDEVPSSGRTLLRYGAVSLADPERSRYEIVLDEGGEEVDLKALSEREAKAFFPGALAPWHQYSYSVKFVCGAQEAADGCCCLPGVRPGIYATEINIHNYRNQGAELTKFGLPLILAGVPRGREPRSVPISYREAMFLPANHATMDDCCRIREMLFGSAPPAGNPLIIGFLEIVSYVELRVTAVYTATDRESRSIAIDVEDVPARIKNSFPFPLPGTPVPFADSGTEVSRDQR